MENKEQTIRSLIDELNHYTKLYDEGKSPISDKAWDDLYFYLEKLEYQYKIYFPDSPTQRVNYDAFALTSLKKVKHNHLMLSLQKTKSLDEIKVFASRYSTICMGKMDGLTCALRYVDGELVAAETRGDGTIGEDIFNNIMRVANVPKRIDKKGEVCIDGEIICRYNDFEPFAKEYENPRSFAAGSIRLLDSDECEKRHLSFVAWDWIDSPFDTLGESLVYLAGLGFTTVPYWDGIIVGYDDFDIIADFIKNACSIDGFPIDGLVFKYDYFMDYAAQGRTNHHFKGGIAYKFYDECVETEIEDIEWSMGREGRLTPVAIFKPVEIDGTEVSRCSLSNLSILEEKMGKPYKGQKVKIAKANMIIPYLVDAQNENGEWIGEL